MQNRRDMFRSLVRILLGLLIAASPLNLSFDLKSGIHTEASKAHAKSGPGKEGDGRDDDDEDDDEGEDDEGEDDEGEDDRNDGNDDDHAQDDEGGQSISGATEIQDDVTIRNIRIVYSNGWEERIRSGRYRLKDPKGRTVADRIATHADYVRLRGIRGN